MGLFEGWKNSFIPDWVCFFFFMCAMLQPYPLSLFLESWMHLSDGRAKVVTLSHHAMRASNDCLREIAISSNVFENISNSVWFLATRQHMKSFPFELRYQPVVRHGAQSCEMALWSSRLPSMEIPLPFLEILE